MTPTDIAKEIRHTMDTVVPIWFTNKLEPVKRDFSWKLVVNHDPEQVRQAARNPDSFRSWTVDSEEALREVLDALPSLDQTFDDLPEIEEGPIFICLWVDDKKLV